MSKEPRRLDDPDAESSTSQLSRGDSVTVIGHVFQGRERSLFIETETVVVYRFDSNELIQSEDVLHHPGTLLRLIVHSGLEKHLTSMLGSQARVLGTIGSARDGHTNLVAEHVAPAEPRTGINPEADVASADEVQLDDIQVEGEDGESMVDELRREMRTELTNIESKMNDQRQELRSDLAAMRAEILEALNSIRADYNSFRTEVRGDLDRLKDNDAKRSAEIIELRGELRVIEARITTATAVILGFVTLVGSVIAILAALGVFS